MSLDVEGVVDRGVGGEEPLGGGLALEALLLPLSSSDWQMGVLHPIILPQPARSVEIAKAEIVQGGHIGSQAIGHNRLRPHRLVAKQPLQQL